MTAQTDIVRLLPHEVVVVGKVRVVASDATLLRLHRFVLYRGLRQDICDGLVAAEAALLDRVVEQVWEVGGVMTVTRLAVATGRGG